MNQIIIGNTKIDVICKDIKNIHLAVYPPSGRVRIAAPLKMTEDAIRLFAISKLSWIKKHQRKFQNQERITPREYKQRESHYFRGKRYLLHITETEGSPKVILRNKTYIDLYVKEGTPANKRHEILTEWYRAELKKQIPALIEKWTKRTNIQVNEWQVKQMKTKWGSCNREKKRIWLNLELAKKPEHCLEYIIVHEMIHLVERHHNEKFLSYIDNYLPNWKQLRTELNRFPVSHSEWKY